MKKEDNGLYEREEALLKHYNSNVNYRSVNVKDFFNHLPDMDFENKRVLDLGCGDGRFSTYLKNSLKATPIGVDFSKERIRKAERNTKGIRYFCMNCYEYVEGYDVVDQGMFDYTLMTEVIEHLENPERLSRSLSKISKNIIGTVPLNFPYVAHLQVYKNEKDFTDQFIEWKLSTRIIGDNIYFWGETTSGQKAHE